MKRFTVKPYDDFKSWGDYDDIKDARAARTKLAMSFFSRKVVLIDNNTGQEVDDIQNQSKKIPNVEYVDWSSFKC